MGEASFQNAALVAQEHALAPADNLLGMIMTAARDKSVDIEKLERLMAMHERLVADQRRMAFNEAMARLAVNLPEIDKKGHVSYDGKEGKPGMDRKYARLEDIDRALRPLYSREGFSMSFDTQEGPGGKIRVVGKLSHVGGHSETKQLDLPHDPSGSKNGIQAVGSTVSYGRRMLTKMFFNLIEKGEDTDGVDPTTISADQIKDIETLLHDTKSDTKKFLELIAGVSAIKDIPARDFKRVILALNTKKQAQQK